VLPGEPVARLPCWRLADEQQTLNGGWKQWNGVRCSDGPLEEPERGTFSRLFQGRSRGEVVPEQALTGQKI